LDTGTGADIQIKFGVGGKEAPRSTSSAGLNNPKELTNNTLPEVIGLSCGRLVTRKFPVNLIFDAGHCDERGNDARPATGFYYGRG